MKKGSKHSLEARQKMSISRNKFFQENPEQKNKCANIGIQNGMYGKKNNWGNHTLEAKKKITEANLHEKNPMFGKTAWNKEKSRFTDLRIEKYANKISQEGHWNWKGGITLINQSIRNSLQYKKWRSECFQRDNYTCKNCGKQNRSLQVDHIKPFALILKENNIKSIEESYSCLELWDLSNDRTLCEECHRQTDTYAGKLNGK